MNTQVTKILLILLLAFVPSGSHAEPPLPKLTLLTEVYPPYNMEVDGKLQGISVDILEAMLEIVGTGQTRDDFILTNWSRAYSMAEKRKNHMVFGCTRTEQREHLFKWVGPITQTTIGIIAPKKKKIVIDTVSALNQYRIGAVLKDIGELMLLELGIKKTQIHSLSGKNAIDLSFIKMENNRIDMFAYEVNVAAYEAQLKGHAMDDFEVIFTLKEGELYYALNKDTDDEIITRLQDALDIIKDNGTYKAILEKY